MHPDHRHTRIDLRIQTRTPCMHLASTPLHCGLLLALITTTGEAAAVEHYQGFAYASKGGELLYSESHWIQDGRERLVLYRCPTGAAFARKRVTGADTAPDFELLDGRDGYREGVRTRNGMREVYVQPVAGKAERNQPLPQGSGQVIDAGFDTYVRKHWDAMGPAQPRSVRFLVPSRMESMDFRLSTLASDAGTRRYRLALDAWYAGVLPSITVTYDASERRLLRFEGIGNIRDAAGDYPAVRIEFPANKRVTSTRAEIQNAARTPLAKGCSNS